MAGCTASDNYLSDQITVNLDWDDCIYENGDYKSIKIPEVVRIITEFYKPKSLITKEILIYENGVYHRGGRGIIAKALNDAFCMLGPSAIGSEKGMPSSIISAPADSSRNISDLVVSRVGSPAVIKGIKALFPLLISSLNLFSILFIDKYLQIFTGNF